MELNFVATSFLLLTCLWSLNSTVAISCWKSTTTNAAVESSPTIFKTLITRGGNLDESKGNGASNEVDLELTSEVVSIEEEEKEAEEEEEEEEEEEAEEEEERAAGEIDGDEDESTSSSLTEIATKLRLEGKQYHDEGDFIKAAEVFQNAADTLLASGHKNLNSPSSSSSLTISEDYATCRLHQALCHLKSEEYELCIDACTDILQDDSEENNSSSAKQLDSFSTQYLPAFSARAYHRRAKAKMALGDDSGALQDARTAAFLGDAKAVTLYGRLLRESSSSIGLVSSSTARDPSASLSSPTSIHSTLLESLMNTSNGNADTGNSNFGGSGLSNSFSPASLLLGNGGNSGTSNMMGILGSGGGGLAKSMLLNLSKKLDDESTHEKICDLLHQTNKAQIGNLASMAGIDNALQDSHVDKLVNFCHGITPTGIRRTLKTTKAMVYVVKVIRRTAKVINKYKSLLATLFIFQWARSSIFRPIPLDKRAAKKAAKLALKQAMKASRAGFF